MAGRFAAAGLQFIDGALEELAEGQQVFEALLIFSQPRSQRLAQTARPLGGSGHGHFSLYAIQHTNIKNTICLCKKNDGRIKKFWGRREWLCGGMVAATRQGARDPRRQRISAIPTRRKALRASWRRIYCLNRSAGEGPSQILSWLLRGRAHGIANRDRSVYEPDQRRERH